MPCMPDPLSQIGIAADVPLLDLLPSFASSPCRTPSLVLRCFGVWPAYLSRSSRLGFPAQAPRLQSVAASGGGKLEAATAYLARKIRFLGIPMIFLQVVQLLSQACCLPLPELLKVKATVK